MKKTLSLQRFLLFYVSSLFVMLILYYALLFFTLKERQRLETEEIFEFLVSEASNDHLNNTSLESIQQYPFFADRTYQLILTTPSGESFIKESHGAHQKNGEKVFLPIPSLNHQMGKNHYQLDNQRLQGWIELPHNYQLYFNVLHKPLQIDWLSPRYWVPFVVLLFLFVIGMFFLIRRRDNWDRVIDYTNELTVQPKHTYQPLPMYSQDMGQEFLRLINGLNRIHYRLYKNHQHINVLEQRIERLITSSPLPMLSIKRNGQISFMNKRFQQVFSASLEDGQRYYLTDFVIGFDKPTHQQLAQINHQRMARTFLVNHLQNNNTYQLHVLPWLGEHGQIQGVTAMLNDVNHLIEDQKINQVTIQKQNARLVEFDRLWSTLGHELRTPLNGMIGMMDLFEVHNLNADQKESFDILKQTSNNLLNMLNDMLDIAKMDAGKLSVSIEATDILSLCKQVCELMIGNARRQGIELLYFFDPTCPRYLYTDEARLRQVLLNLINNAIKFTYTGYVALIIEMVDLDKVNTKNMLMSPILIKDLQSHGDSRKWLCFSVKDTGIGIKKEEQQKLFSYFNQANDNISRQFGGTGLGLAISKNFAHLLGGFIHLYSQQYNGSEFSVYFPYKENNHQPVYHFNTKLSQVCLVAFCSQGISAKYLRTLCNHLELSALVRSTIQESMMGWLENQLKIIKSSGLIPIILIEYELYAKVDLEILNQLPDYADYPKLLLSMMPERGISPILLEQYDGYLSKPLDINHFLSELVRLAQSGKHQDQRQQEDNLSPAQRSFNQFLSTLAEAEKSSTVAKAANDLNLPVQKVLAPTENQSENRSENRSEEDKPLILVAEDNPVNQTVAGKVLERLGYRSIMAKDGSEAIDILQRNRDEIQLILMDCRMPGMDGITATEKIRAMQDSIPIVALTANDTDADRNACLKAGMNGFLSKPLRKELLEKTLNKYLI